MADPRESTSSYLQPVPRDEGSSGQSAPQNQSSHYYQSMHPYYGVAVPSAPTVPVPQNTASPYLPPGAQALRPAYPHDYPQIPGTTPVYPPGFPSNAYGQTTPPTLNPAYFSPPPNPGSVNVPYNPNVSYYAAAPQPFGPPGLHSSQSLPNSLHYPGRQSNTGGGWYATGPQGTNRSHYVPAQYSQGSQHITGPQSQNTGYYTSPNLASNAAPLPQYPPPGTFVLYSPRRMVFSETSGQGPSGAPYKRPCLVHDILTEPSGKQSLLLVPLTGSRGGSRRKLTMRENWWQPVQWQTYGDDVPAVPKDSCRTQGSSGALRRIPRNPIPLFYVNPPPGTRTALGEKIPEFKSSYIWVGDVGEVIPMEDTVTLDALTKSILSPWYSVTERTISDLHFEMKYWMEYSPPPKQPADMVPDKIRHGYPQTPPPERYR